MIIFSVLSLWQGKSEETFRDFTCCNIPRFFQPDLVSRNFYFALGIYNGDRGLPYTILVP